MPEKINLLEAKHPIYSEWEKTWKLYRDVVSGEWDQTMKEQYLVKGEIEPGGEFQKRAQLSEFLGDSCIGVTRIVSSLFRDIPTRVLPPKIQKMADSANKKGKSIDIVMAEVAEKGVIYGACHILIDKRSAPEGISPANRAEEIALGIDNPILSVFTPLDMWNWEVDDDGRYLWVRFVSTITRQDSPDEARKSYRIYREFDRTSWRVFSAEIGRENPIPIAESIKKIGAGEHGLGVVPVVTLIPLSEIQPAIGRSFVARSSKSDLKAFRRDSDLQWDLYVHAHPTLVLWTTRLMKDVGVGSNTYIKLEPGDKEHDAEDAKYLDIPASAFDGHFRAIELAKSETYSNMGIDPMGVLGSGDGPSSASGVSRAWSFSTSEARLLAFIADALEQCESEIFYIACLWEDESSSTINIRYPDNFDLVSAMDLIKAYIQIGKSIKSKEFHVSTLQRISTQMVGDVGQEKFAKILKEIEDAGIPEPEDFAKPEGDRFNRDPSIKREAEAGLTEENPGGNEPKSENVA